MFRRHFHNTKRNCERFEFGFGRGQERFGDPQGRERFLKKVTYNLSYSRCLKKNQSMVIKSLRI